MTARTEQKQNTRKSILKAAAGCFAERGYSGCSVADIMERAGVSKGCMYVHFKSKEELFIEMIRNEHQLGAERARKAAGRKPYLDGIIWYMKECTQNSGFPMDHRLWTEVLAVAGRDRAVKETFLASEKAGRKVLIELLEKAAHAGEIDASLDLELVSIWVFALGDGLIARIADDPDFDLKKGYALFEKLIRRALGSA